MPRSPTRRRSAGSAALISRSSASPVPVASGPASDRPSAARSSGSSGARIIALLPTSGAWGQRCRASTPSWAGFHARTSAPQVSGSASNTAPQAACGANCPARSMSSARRSCSARTSAGCSVAGSITCSPIWPASGSMRSGRVSEPATWEHPTDENGSSSWPTPSAVDYGSSQNGSNNTRPSAGTPSLSTRARTWPTPVVTHQHASARSTTTTGRSHAGTTLTDAMRAWPTPLARDGSSNGGAPGPKRHDLQHEAKHWSTPLATETHAKEQGAADGRPNPWPNLTQQALTHGRRDLTTPKPGRGGLVLNPGFVESLMGFPDGFTVPVSPRHFAALVSELLETRSSSSKPPKPSAGSCGPLFEDGDT